MRHYLIILIIKETNKRSKKVKETRDSINTGTKQHLQMVQRIYVDEHGKKRVRWSRLPVTECRRSKQSVGSSVVRDEFFGYMRDFPEDVCSHCRASLVRKIKDAQ